MPVEVTSLSELDVDKVQQNHALLRQMVQEDNSTIDVFGGVFDELILYYGGVLSTINQENLELLDRSGSLLEIEADPTIADEEAVDKVTSNFMVERKTGGLAGGTVKIVVDKLAPTTVANGALFEANGQQFTANNSYVARTSAENATADTDRVLTPLPDGNFAFTIDVTAIEPGAAGQLLKDTLIVPQSPPLNFVKSQAASDFVGGTDTETNAQLIERLAEGPAVKALSGPTTMKATLKAREDFKDVLQSSIIGMGDAEMLRDKHWIWPSGGGGRVDWYVRTQERPQRLSLTKTATLVQKTADNRGIWQINFNKDEAPGFYDVLFIQFPDGTEQLGSLVVTEDIRGFDLTGDEDFVPDIANAVEGAYSPYQTASIKFRDHETDTTSLAINSSTQDYEVTVRIMPLLAAIQGDMGSRNTKNAAGDLLVKGPVPCFLRLSFTVGLRPTATAPDTDTIAEALASVVNNYGFAGRLPASVLTDTIHNFLTDGASVGAVDMWGEIRRPDMTTKSLRGSTLLTIPDEPSRLVTPRTVVFFLDPEDVSIAIETLDVPEV